MSNNESPEGTGYSNIPRTPVFRSPGQEADMPPEDGTRLGSMGESGQEGTSQDSPEDMVESSPEQLIDNIVREEEAGNRKRARELYKVLSSSASGEQAIKFELHAFGMGSGGPADTEKRRRIMMVLNNLQTEQIRDEGGLTELGGLAGEESVQSTSESPASESTGSDSEASPSVPRPPESDTTDAESSSGTAPEGPEPEPSPPPFPPFSWAGSPGGTSTAGSGSGPEGGSGGTGAEEERKEKTLDELQKEYDAETKSFAEAFAGRISKQSIDWGRSRQRLFGLEAKLKEKKLEKAMQDVSPDYLDADWFAGTIKDIELQLDQHLLGEIKHAQEEFRSEPEATGFWKKVEHKGAKRVVGEWLAGKESDSMAKRIAKAIGFSALVGAGVGLAVSFAPVAAVAGSAGLTGVALGAGVAGATGAARGALGGYLRGVGKYGEAGEAEDVTKQVNKERKKAVDAGKKGYEITYGKTKEEIINEIREAASGSGDEVRKRQLSTAQAVLRLGSERREQELGQRTKEVRKERRKRVKLGQSVLISVGVGLGAGLAGGAIAGGVVAGGVDLLWGPGGEEDVDASGKEQASLESGERVEPEADDNEPEQGSQGEADEFTLNQSAANEVMHGLGITESIDWGEVDVDELAENPLINYDSETGAISLVEQPNGVNLGEMNSLAETLGVDAENINISAAPETGEISADNLHELLAEASTGDETHSEQLQNISERLQEEYNGEVINDVQPWQGPTEFMQNQLGLSYDKAMQVYNDPQVREIMLANGDGQEITIANGYEVDQANGFGLAHTGDLKPETIIAMYEAAGKEIPADILAEAGAAETGAETRPETSSAEANVQEQVDAALDERLEPVVHELNQTNVKDYLSMAGFELTPDQVAALDAETLQALANLEGSPFEVDDNGVIHAAGSSSDIASYLSDVETELNSHFEAEGLTGDEAAVERLNPIEALLNDVHRLHAFEEALEDNTTFDDIVIDRNRLDDLAGLITEGGAFNDAVRLEGSTLEPTDAEERVQNFVDYLNNNDYLVRAE